MLDIRLSLPSLARLTAVAAVTLLAVLVGASPAAAHPSLVQSDPTPGVVAQQTPMAITLSFSEPIAPSGSVIKVRTLDGGAAETGRPTSDAGEATVAVPVRGDLAGGVYEVEWSVVGTDGHLVGGTFRFGVAAANGALPQGVEQLSVAPGTNDNATLTLSSGVLAVYLRWLGVVAAALMFGGGVLARRARAVGAQVPKTWAGRIATGAWAIALTTEIQRTIAIADAGQQPGLDPGLLTDTQSGVLALVRVGALALLGCAALRGRRLGMYGAAGAAALVTHALDGHTAAVSSDKAVAWIESIAHVGAAGAWVGGLLAILLWTGLGRAPFWPLVRAFAPVAGAAMGALAVTGVLIAVRQVDSWTFLRWTGYGQVVIAKSVLLLCVLVLSSWIFWWGRRMRDERAITGSSPSTGVGTGTSPSDSVRFSPRILLVEAAVAVALIMLASVLSGLVPGRGQPEFAQRGNLLTGAALATAAMPDGLLHVTVAPATPGVNTISVVPLALRETDAVKQPDTVEVRLACPCTDGDQRVQLRQTAPGVWSARVELADEGSWFAYLNVNDQRATAPVSVTVQDRHEGGPDPFVVRATADLSGNEAERCRAFVQGLAIGVGRLNAAGGVDGGRKVVLDVRDDGGDPARANLLAEDGSPGVLAPCGPGAVGAIRASGDALTLAGDPATPSTETGDEGDQTANLFRIALDPFAEGFGIGTYLEQTVLAKPSSAPYRVAVVTHDRAGEQRLAGLRSALAARDVRVERLSTSAAEREASLRRITDPKRYVATLLDGDSDMVSTALRKLGDDTGFTPTALFVSSRLATEEFMLAAGLLGRLGALRIASEVLPDSADGQAYANAVGAIFLGDRARIAGLRGYVTGLTLAEAVRDGTGMEEILGRMRRPARYTDALNVPWREDAPSLGTQGFAIYSSNFLPPTLVPESIGGMAYSGRFFQKGAWSRVAPMVYGPPVGRPVAQR